MPSSVQTRTTQSSGFMRELRHHPGKDVEQRYHGEQISEHKDVNIAPGAEEWRRLIGHFLLLRRTFDHPSNSPCMTVTACPERITRFPSRRTPTSPPRAEAWNARNVVLPSFCAQYGPRAQCAEPVTGSS